MRKFRKEVSLKIISIIIGSLCLCSPTLYSCPVSESSLRVSLGNYERLKKAFPGGLSRRLLSGKRVKYDIGDCDIDDGVFAEVFIPKSEDVNFIIKAVRNKNENKKSKTFLKTYKLAKNNLGGLAAKTTLVKNVTFIINGREHYFKAALIQEKVTPLDKIFNSLSEKEAKRILDEIFSLERELYKRGIHNIDHKILRAHGLNAQGKVVFFDFTGMANDKTSFYLKDPEGVAFKMLKSSNHSFLREQGLIDYYDKNEITIDEFESLWATRMVLRKRIDGISLPQWSQSAISTQNLRKFIFNIPFLRNWL